MSEYQNLPPYQSAMANQSMYATTESTIMRDLNNYTNPVLSSTEMKYDEKDVIVQPAKYEEPRYIKKNEVYEEKAPEFKGLVNLPSKKKEKVRTTKTIYNKEIVVTSDEELNRVLADPTIFGEQAEFPLPTQSTILNLCKDSVVGSSYYPSSSVLEKEANPNSSTNNNQSKITSKLLDQNIYNSEIVPETNDNQYTQKMLHNQSQSHANPQGHSTHTHASINQNPNLKSNMNYNNNNNNNFNYISKIQPQQQKFQSTLNTNKNYNISKVNELPNPYTSTYQDYTNQKTNKINAHKEDNKMSQKMSNIQQNDQQKKSQMPNMSYGQMSEGGFVESSQGPEKTYVQKYFHDDDIPKPEVFEGSGLKSSEIGENNSKMAQNDKKSKIVTSSNKVSNSKSSSIRSSNNNNNNSNYQSFQKNQKMDSKIQQAESLLKEIPIEKTVMLSQQQASTVMSQVNNSKQMPPHQSKHGSEVNNSNASGMQQSNVSLKPSSKYQQQNNAGSSQYSKVSHQSNMYPNQNPSVQNNPKFYQSNITNKPNYYQSQNVAKQNPYYSQAVDYKNKKNFNQNAPSGNQNPQMSNAQNNSKITNSNYHGSKYVPSVHQSIEDSKMSMQGRETPNFKNSNVSSSFQNKTPEGESKITQPHNPFFDKNYAVNNNSHLPTLESKIKDSEIK